MILPQNRMLFWVAAIALPFSVLGAILPGAQFLALALIVALLATTLLDAILAQDRLDGIRIELPSIIRLSKGHPAQIEIVVHRPKRSIRTLRLGWPLPEHFQPGSAEMQLALPDQGDSVRFAWPLCGLRRGRFMLSETRLESCSPLGFWTVRAWVSSPTEIRVYPNLHTDRRQLAGLFLHRGIYGIHARRQVGKGREFEKLREYIPGDSFEDVHWKATAKRGHPVTKVYQIERTQEVYVVIDTSRLSAREVLSPRVPPLPGSTKTGEGPSPSASRFTEPVLERYLTAALLLGAAAERQGDLFGLLALSSQIDAFIRARNGRPHYHACRDALYTLQPQPVTPDFDEAATFIQLRLRRRALLVFLTALDDPVLAESFVRSAELLGRRHLVLVNMLRPPGANPLFSHPDVETVDDLYDRLGGHLRWHKLRELGKVLQRRGVRLTLTDQEGLCRQLIAQYLDIKRRQLL